MISDRNRKKSESKVPPNTAQINPQINTVQPAPQLTIGGTVLSTPGNLKPIQPATNLNNTQTKTFDESSMLTKNGNGEKRGPGRPKGSTNKGTEQKQLLAQQSNDIIKGMSFVLYYNIQSFSKNIENFQNKMTLTCFIISGKISNDPPPLKKAKLDAGDNDSTPSTDSGNQLTVDVVKNNPLKWNVEQVCDFVKNLAGCSDYVEDFQLQEIDGQALMLLKADHLMSAMSIKLGPALKICSAIEGMRDELSKN